MTPPVIVRPVRFEDEPDTQARATRNPSPSLAVGHQIEVKVGAQWVPCVVVEVEFSAPVVRRL